VQVTGLTLEFGEVLAAELAAGVTLLRLDGTVLSEAEELARERYESDGWLRRR
jgi:hypothetical protein